MIALHVELTPEQARAYADAGRPGDREKAAWTNADRTIVRALLDALVKADELTEREAGEARP